MAGERGWLMKPLTALTPRACRPWLGFAVADRSHEPLGTLRSLWAPEGTGQVRFFGVQAAGTASRDLLAPAEGAQVDAGRRRIRLPYARAQVQGAPAYAPCAKLTPERQGEIYLHYGLQAALRPPSGPPFCLSNNL